MAKGRHITTKKQSSPTFSKTWSGVSYAPHCRNGCLCPKCGERLHAEVGEHYCPRCDDYVKPEGKAHQASG